MGTHFPDLIHRPKQILSDRWTIKFGKVVRTGSPLIARKIYPAARRLKSVLCVWSRSWLRRFVVLRIRNLSSCKLTEPLGGMAVLTVREWARRWKKSAKFPECHACGSKDTKLISYHDDCVDNKRRWTSESLCLDCHKFTWREYCTSTKNTSGIQREIKGSEQTCFLVMSCVMLLFRQRVVLLLARGCTAVVVR